MAKVLGEIAEEAAKPVGRATGQLLGWLFNRGAKETAESTIPRMVVPKVSGLPDAATSAFPKAADPSFLTRTLNKIPGISGVTSAYGRLPKIIRYGLPAAGIGVPVGLNIWGQPEAALPTYSGIPSTYDISGQTEANLQSYIDRLRDIYGETTPYDYVGATQGSTARQRAALDAYLADAAAASGQMAQDVEDRYRNLSLQMLGTAQAGERTGQLTARDIDQLYGRLADVGTTAPDTGTVTSGLTPVSGAAATSPQTTRTYGRSLADYLGAETAASTAAGERLAAATAGLGAGIGAGMAGSASAQERAQRLAFDLQAEQAFQQALAQQAAERQAAAERRIGLEADIARMEMETEQSLLPRRMLQAQAAVDLAGVVNTALKDSDRFQRWVIAAAQSEGVPPSQANDWLSEQIQMNPAGVATAISSFVGVDRIPPSVSQLQMSWFQG